MGVACTKSTPATEVSCLDFAAADMSIDGANSYSHHLSPKPSLGPVPPKTIERIDKL